MRKQTKIWETKNGEKTRICDMSDGHLINTLKLLRRSGKALALRRWSQTMTYLATDPPDGATLAAENECTFYESIAFGTFECPEGAELDDYILGNWPIYTNLLYEAERRNIMSRIYFA